MKYNIFREKKYFLSFFPTENTLKPPKTDITLNSRSVFFTQKDGDLGPESGRWDPGPPVRATMNISLSNESQCLYIVEPVVINSVFSNLS